MGTRVEHDLLLVGLDASPLRIGYAIAWRDMILESGALLIDRDDDIRSRKEAWKTIRKMIRKAEAKTRRDAAIIGIEDAYLGPNRMGSLHHARTIGQLEAFAFSSCPYALIARVPSVSWRKALGISTRGKEAPFEYATLRLDYGYHVDSQDEADAICIVLSLPVLFSEGT